MSIDHPSYSHSKKRQAISYFRKCKNINSKTTRNWEGTRETSATTIIPENESIQFTLGNNKQLLYEAEHDVKNYSDRGYCYPSTKVDKSLQALYNSSHFRIIVYYLTLGIYGRSSKLRPFSRQGVRMYLNRCLYSSKSGYYHRGICFAYSRISSVQFQSEIQLFGPLIFFSSASFPG